MPDSGTETAAREWELWSTSARLVVDEPRLLGAALATIEPILHNIDSASSRFRNDSEIVRLQGRLGGGAEVSAMLATLVAKALEAAELTEGLVVPTLGRQMAYLGYDRDYPDLAQSPTTPAGGTLSSASISVRLHPPAVRDWRAVRLEGNRLTVPDGVLLDLGATAKAVAADLCAAAVHRELGCSALVSLGGDIATAGPKEWGITVQDLPGDPAAGITLAGGRAVATSSTQKRRWLRDGAGLHHILDPRTGLPAEPHWRSATVAADSCLHANAASTAAVVLGAEALGWLRRTALPARLVDGAGRVHPLNGWPQEAELAALGSAGELS